MNNIVFYTTLENESPVEDFLNSLPDKDADKMHRAILLLAQFGTRLPMPHNRKIVGVDGLYELRSQVGSNIRRIFYFSIPQKESVLLHGFTKKSQKTPQAEIEIAANRMKDYLERSHS